MLRSTFSRRWRMQVLASISQEEAQSRRINLPGRRFELELASAMDFFSVDGCCMSMSQGERIVPLGMGNEASDQGKISPLWAQRFPSPSRQPPTFKSRWRWIAALTSIIIRVPGPGRRQTDRLLFIWHTFVSLSNRSFPSTPSLTNWWLTSRVSIKRSSESSSQPFESSGSPHSGAKTQKRAVGDGGQCRGAVLVSLGFPSIGCFCRSVKESNATTRVCKREMTRTSKLAGFDGDVSQDGQLVNN